MELLRPMAVSPSTLVLAIDTAGWAFHNIAREIARGLGNLFSETVIAESSRLTSSFPGRTVLVCFWWGDACRLRANVRPQALITCVYDHESFSANGQITQEFRMALKQSDLLAVCNEDLRTEITARSSGLQLPPIFVVPDGVDTRLFTPTPLPPGPPIVGWCGNSARIAGDYKGLGLIREACRAANVELHILDSAKGAARPLHDMPEFYQSVSSVVCMSIREGTPNPIFEGMASQRVPISTPVGIAQRAIKHGLNGFLLQDRSAQALTQVLLQLKQMSPDLRMNLARCARAEVEQRWSWDVMLQNWRLCLQAGLAFTSGTSRPMADVSLPVTQQAPVAPEVQGIARTVDSLAPASPPTVLSRPHTRPAEHQVTALQIEAMAERGGILLLSDVRDWAFHQNMWDLELSLGDRHRFSHWFVIDWCHAMLESRNAAGALPAIEVNERVRVAMQRFDTVFCVYHRWGIDAMLPWAKTVGSLRALWFKPEMPAPPTPEDVALVNRFRAFHVVTSQNYEELQGRCPRVVYLTNPVNMRRFSEPTPVQDEVICSWNGNAQHVSGANVDVKGFNTIIKPVCESLGQPLIVAEYNTSRLSPAEMPAFYRNANLSLCMSLYEGCSNSTLEAMASGQALISTDCGNVREMQQSQLREFGDTGIVIVERTPEALVQALQMLRSKPDRVIEMGRLNRQEIAARWSWSVWAPRYEEFLCPGM